MKEPQEKNKSSTERTARYKERMKAKGYFRLSAWVHHSLREPIQRIIDNFKKESHKE